MSDIGINFETVEFEGEISPPSPPTEFPTKFPHLIKENNESPPSTSITSLLQEVLQGQNAINEKMDKIEKTLKRLQANQVTLSKGQATLNSNQKRIANKLEVIDANAATKAEVLVQSKLLTECKVAIKRIQSSLRRMTGENFDTVLDEIAGMLPLRTVEAVEEVEEKLNSPEFTEAMTCYVYKLKGVSEDVGTTIREIFTDDLLNKYNWDGRWDRLPLGSLLILNKVIRNIFQAQGALDFERSVKKALERSHHRTIQKNYMKARK